MPNTYTLLETITVGAAGASSVTFNSIPQTGYTDLVIKASVRTNNNAVYDNIQLRFNGDSGANYSRLFLVGDGSTTQNFKASGNTSFVPSYSINAANATANTFSNGEFYIPNFTSSNQKSISLDTVVENNATAGYDGISAGLWSGTAAITSVNFTPGSGTLFLQYSTFSLYGVSALGVTPTKAPKATGGSIIQTDGTYWYHAFLSSGTFTPATALSCDYLVVAGGGGGQASNANGLGEGGGGAGGLRSTVTATGGGGSLETALALAGGTGYTVTIGAGGAGGTDNSSSFTATAGSNSVFSSITSIGGGRGGANGAGAATSGGSGGGAPGSAAGQSAGAGTTGQGYAGGGGPTGGTPPGSGGGGAGAIGVASETAGTGRAGAGGAGVAISAFATVTGTGVSNYYAGGGGGSVGSGAAGVPTGGAGGAGGGGAGTANATNGGAGTANTGGGGGAGGNTNVGFGQGGAGGSGIVIVRYLA